MMLAGYNTNVTYKGNTYHIQTEDSGLKNPVVVTLLYAKGAILTSKKTSYAHIVDDPDYKEKIKELMKQQHKTMIKELLSGRYTGEFVREEGKSGPSEPAEATPVNKNQISESLDDILLNYIIKRK
jgi:ketol-acid reductoisomerase